jgi:glycoside/pentoside/hexuronide:cation symporter, GPH family
MSNRKLPFGLKLAFGVGDATEGIKNGSLATFLLFYYSQVLGLPPALTATAVGTSVIMDGLDDPIIGSISDHWKSKWGRRHPFMFASALPFALSIYLLFNPLVESQGALFVWLIVFTNLTRLALTLFYVPHAALGAEITDDYAERSSIAGYRVFFTYLGAMVVILIGWGVFFRSTPEFKNGQLNPAAYPPFGAALAGIILVIVLWSAWGTRSVIPRLPKPRAEAPLQLWGALARVVKDVVSAARAKSFRWLFMGVLILYVVIGIGAALNLYMYTYFWEITPAQIIWLSPAYLAGTLLGSPLCSWAQRRFGKKPMLLFGAGSWAFWQAVPVSLRLMGVLPENGSDLLIPILLAIAVFQGLCTVHSNVAYVAMLADTVDEQELATGQRQEGIFFAASGFSVKATSGLGAILAGIGLNVIAWPTGPQIRSAADIPPETITHLGILCGPFVAAFGLLCLLCYRRYSLTRERHAEILGLLEQRRSQEAA